MDSSPEAATAVLHGLFGWADTEGELIEVSVKSPAGKWNSEHLPSWQLRDPDTVRQMAAWSRAGRETYVGCVGLTERPKFRWRRGGAALRGHAGALWLDVDVQAPGREGAEYFETVEDAVTAVDACLGGKLAGASLVIGSGWGVQYWLPLRDPVPGRLASQAVRVLVGMVGECTTKKIDRVWDVTRVMRMPGTWNWRAGPDPDAARPSGVLRWPGLRDGERPWRLRLGDVVDELGRLHGDPPGVKLETLLERYGGTVGAEDSDPGAYAGDWVGDIERIAFETLTWGDVLEPFGWRCVSGGLSADEHEQVWERPGKVGSPVETGDRSAVVYQDRPELLVVYSDSTSTGFSAGLRGSGHRGEGAGVGVISKWRAWVDLAWAGDEREALDAVVERAGEMDERDGADGGHGIPGAGDPVAERLGEAWTSETAWMGEWAVILDEGVWEATKRVDGGRRTAAEMLGFDPEELPKMWARGEPEP